LNADLQVIRCFLEALIKRFGWLERKVNADSSNHLDDRMLSFSRPLRAFLFLILAFTLRDYEKVVINSTQGKSKTKLLYKTSCNMLYKWLLFTHLK